MTNKITSENVRPSNTREAAEASLWRFLKPLSKEPKPGTTGMAAVKKEQLPEHGFTSLSEQRQQNIKGGK